MGNSSKRIHKSLNQVVSNSNCRRIDWNFKPSMVYFGISGLQAFKCLQTSKMLTWHNEHTAILVFLSLPSQCVSATSFRKTKTHVSLVSSWRPNLKPPFVKSFQQELWNQPLSALPSMKSYQNWPKRALEYCFATWTLRDI